MKIILRYILWELIQSFFFAFLAMMTLLIIVGLVREALDKNVPLEQILRLVPFVMVEMSRIAIPVTFLLAVTTFFARMSGNNEVIALKSLGIPPWMFLWPVMVIGILVSLLTVWLNDMAVTWGRQGVATVIYSAAEDIILNQLRNTHRFTSPDGKLTMMVRGVDNRQLVSPTITYTDSSGTTSTIEAKSAKLNIDFSKKHVTIALSQIKAGNETGSYIYIAEDRVIQFPLETIVEEEGDGKRPADMGLNEMPHYIAECESEMMSARRKIAANKAFSGSMGSVAPWGRRDTQEIYEQLRELKDHYNRIHVEYPRRWSSGFSCLFFIWLGAPLAIWMKKSDIFTSFFACFIPILLLYYPLLMLGLQGAKNGKFPPDAVWIANIVLGIVGLWFLKRIHRY